MDWLTQYWPYLIAAGLLVVLVARVSVVLLPKYRQPVRHSGERTIRVIGVGGAGGNAVNHMIRAKQRGVDYVAVNTDAQVLDDSLAPRRVQIGEQLTQGLGAGGDAAIGRQAAEEDTEEISRMVAGSDLVFIAAGLGGGTGSGAAPVIAAQARKVGALTVGVVTRPFEFEGVGRRKIADAAWVELRANVDTLLVIENERVVALVGEETSMLEAFTVVNEVLAGIVRAVVDIMTVPGLINLDFADVRAIMQEGGMATAGIGAAVGPDRAVAAARAAVTNPLLNHDLAGAGAILLNVAGASGMTMSEVKRAAEVVRSAADPDAMIIFGTIFDDHLDDELRVTVIATRLRNDFAYVHRVASDTESVSPTEEPAPAGAVAAAAVLVAAMEPDDEDEVEDEAPRWAAIPIVTSDDEPVAVVASGASAAAGMDAAPEPLAPWAASQAYTTYVEPAPAEESAPPSEESWSPPADEAQAPVEASAAPAEQPSSEPAQEPEGSHREPWVAAVFAQSEPDEAVPEALAEQSWSAPTDAAVDDESEAAELSSSAPADETPEPKSEPWAAAAVLAAATFAQSDPDQTVSEHEPAEEPAPTEPALTAQPYEALDSGRWSAATALAATTFAQSAPDQTVSGLESAEQPEPAPAGQAWFDPADETPGLAAAGQPWFDRADEVGQAAASPEPAWSAEPEVATAEPEPWAAAPVLAPAEPELAAPATEEAPEPAATEQSWGVPTDEVPEPAPDQPTWSAGPEEAPGPDESPEPETWAAATVLAPAEPELASPEPDEAPEPAAAEQSWVAPTDDAPEPAPDQPTWSAEPEESPEPEPWAAANAAIAPAEPEVATLATEAVDASSEAEPWSASVEAASEEASPSEPVAAELEVEPSAAAPAAQPPWYDPGDEALDAARSAATPAFTASEESKPPTPESPPHAASAPAPPSKVAVSGKAAPRAPEPPPSQLALRTTQAVLTGVWKRLQKPPDPPR